MNSEQTARVASRAMAAALLQMNEQAQRNQQIPDARAKFREQWNQWDINQRQKYIQNLHNQLAGKYGFSPIKVYVEDLVDPKGMDARGVRIGAPGGVLGAIWQFFKGERGKDHIVMDIDNVNTDNPWDVQETLLHESRHQMQEYFVENPRKLPADISQNDLSAWRSNLRHYRRAENDFEAYYKQPIEADARQFAEQNLNQMYLSE